jgi:hypothetical protein
MMQAASLAELDAVEEAAQLRIGGFGRKGPEYVWPADMSWIVCTDYDLTSTYVAMSGRGPDSLLDSPNVEAVAVRLTTRVDDRADEQTT